MKSLEEKQEKPQKLLELGLSFYIYQEKKLFMKKEKIERRNRRKIRIRSRIFGTSKKPRLSVFRSNKHIFVQLINDEKGVTLISASDLELRKIGRKKDENSNFSKTEVSQSVGELLAKKILKKKIKKIVFDRSGFKYHGRVKELAESLRKGGIEF